MDLYLTSAEPGLTLQEMIDCDIKSSIDFESGFAGDSLASFDIGTMSGLDAEELDIKTFGPLFDPLDHLEDEEISETGNARVPTGGESSPMASWMNLSTMANCNLDFETSLMVNPSDVLPSPHYLQAKRQRASPPLSITVKKEPQEIQQKIPSCLNSPVSPVTTQVILQPITTSTITTTSQNSRDVIPSSVVSQNLIITNSPSNTHRHITTTAAPVHTTLQLNTSAVSSAAPNSTSAISVYQPSLRQATTLPFTPNRTKPLPKYPRRERTPEEKSYPKPAYSYACLIALALKNSITGSLPVSEIYSFMCEHFPYFRTAPNGWKNSVRHNLSLNKCFEKIEKPVVSGSNQRKGCLWALNPLKAHKMDEEVQKWSKKDLQGIKDAMTCPEVLESLEKGEMKFEATSGASSCSEDEEEEEIFTDSGFLTEHSQQTTIAPIKVISSTPVGITQAISVQSHQNGFRSSPNSITHRESSITTAIPSPHGHSQQVVRTISSSPEPEYILPDSTMPEINIQSNGSLIDDFGNEITLDGDLSILNPRGTMQSSGANLILRKVNASPLRNSSIRSNFVYTTTGSTNLLPHQNGISRLVLTNTKLSS